MRSDEARQRLDRVTSGANPVETIAAATEPFEVPAPVGPPQPGTRWLGGSRAALAGVVVMLALVCGGAARFVLDDAGPPLIDVPRPEATSPVASRATGGALWPAAPAGTPQVPASSGSDATSPSGRPSGVGTPAALLVVHVVGQVRRAGIVRLSAGARVEDAITAAGGASPSADLTRVNLARLLVDGEQIMVPRPGDPLTGGLSNTVGY